MYPLYKFIKSYNYAVNCRTSRSNISVSDSYTTDLHYCGCVLYLPEEKKKDIFIFANTEALESKDEDVPIKFVDMSQTEPSPDSKRMSTFKPEESTHL